MENVVNVNANEVVADVIEVKSANQSTFSECSRRWRNISNEVETITAVETKSVAVAEELEAEFVETTALDIVSEAKSLALVTQQHKANEVIKHARANELTKECASYLGYEAAEPIINRLIDDHLLDSTVKARTIDGEENYIFQYITRGTGLTAVLDILEPENGTGTISENNTFDAVYRTDLRGGETYPIIFGTVTLINSILEHLSVHEPELNQKHMLQALAYNLALSGMSMADITKVVSKLVHLKYLEEYNNFKKEVKIAKFKIKRSFKKISDAELEALYLLEGYAYLKGTSKFIDLNSDEYKTVTKAQLIDDFANNKIEVMNEDTGILKMINPVTLYLESKHRKEFDGIAFDPSNKLDPRIYNLFRGYKVEGKEAPYRIKKFKEFVKTIICSRDELMFNIVWSFFAQMFQNPWEKKGTALVMVSAEGSGKSLVMRVMGKLMGNYYMSGNDNSRVTSKFNEHLEQTLLFYSNEASLKDKASSVSKLKNLITEVDGSSELKGGDTYSTKNYTHFVIDANGEVPVEQNEGSRRFITLHVDESRIGDLAYYGEIVAEINSDGFHEAMMYDLMNFDYSEYEDYLRRPPKPEVTDEQIQENFDAIVAWWTACLVDGRIPYVEYELTPDDKLNILNEDMFRSFKKWCLAHEYKNGFNSSTFGKEFREQALGRDSKLDSKGKITINGERKHSHVYAEVGSCRESFSSRKQLNSLDYNGSEWKLPLVS